MTELDLIASLRPAVPLPDEGDLAAARSRLMTTLAFEPGGASAQAPALLPQYAQPGRRSAAPRLRRGMVVGAAAAAGVAVACAVTLAVSAGTSGKTQAGGHGQSVPATLTAVQFLTAAAAATGHEHAGSPPAPDQYVYTETVAPVTDGPGSGCPLTARGQASWTSWARRPAVPAFLPAPQRRRRRPAAIRRPGTCRGCRSTRAPYRRIWLGYS